MPSLLDGLAQLCCCRSLPTPHGETTRPAELADGEEAKTLSSADVAAGGGPAVIPEFRSQGLDGSRFRRAQKNSDLPALVALLSSQQPVDYVARQIHPWVKNPKTVGALTALQIGIIASSGNSQDKKGLLDAGAVQPLLGVAASDEEDLAQAAVVALTFLTTDNRPCAQAAADVEDAVPTLLQHAGSKTVGMRAAVATVLRNICAVNEDHRGRFVELGGLSLLVSLLSVEHDPGLNHADVQLEAVLNLQDMIETSTGEVIRAYALEAVNAGAEKQLQTLAICEDEDICASAKEVLASLREATR